jgi:hypothetical protein
MPALTLIATTLAGSALAGSALLCPPPDAEPYTAMDAYVRSLEFWHRNPDWGFSAPSEPSCRPLSPTEPC